MAITLNGTTGIVSPKVNTPDLELNSVNVVERGSNANGEYVRFADGTQICTRAKVSVAQPTTASGGVFVGNAQTSFTFAASFTTFPAVTAFVDGGLSNVGLIMGTDGSSSSGFAVLPWRPTSFAANPTISYIAIGRWY